MTNVNELIQSIDNDQMGGSIYSREDVKRILQMVKVTAQPSININKLCDELQKIKRAVEDLEFDTDSAEFSLSGNEISLDSCEVNSDDVRDDLEQMIDRLHEGYYDLDIVELERD
jgi:hypothetical protein